MTLTHFHSPHTFVRDKLDELSAPFLIVDDFLSPSVALALRADFDRHFSEPDMHQPEAHQIWNYWFVPNSYIYLRTTPAKILSSINLDAFVESLRRFASESLGLDKIGLPYLSLYVAGCSQNLHNDATNGRFAYVYSLTREPRATIGGKTILLREGDPFLNRMKMPSAGVDFYDTIEPTFNRLILFDDRLVHGVERVDGSMDPLHGRVVLHGHINEGGPWSKGGLTISELKVGIIDVVSQFLDENAASIRLCHGLLMIRFEILPNGKVSKCMKILDRVIYDHNRFSDRSSLQARIMDLIKMKIFPKCSENTVVTLPLSFEGKQR